MSHNLWRYLFEDDVDSFRQYLANATLASGPTRNAGGHTGNYSFKIGSPGGLGTSPQSLPKQRKSSGYTQVTTGPTRNNGIVLTRADVNAKDSFGRTMLHHAASLRGTSALAFVKTLLEIPFIDLYAQDTESGWTALHRALYFGNISVARALMSRDIQDATDYTTSVAHTHAGGLIKIKDHEGNSPFEIFGLTIAPRVLVSDNTRVTLEAGDDESTNSIDLNDDNEHERHKNVIRPIVDLRGDEVFSFGSNKNLTLGVGDEDDRHYPERLQFSRPEHLLFRLYEDRTLQRRRLGFQDDLSASTTSVSASFELPARVRNQPLTIQDVVMSKLHTAVLSNDTVSNLYICGFGPGGRLGTGDEATSFSFKCIQGGGLAKRHISTVALGQDHTIAITSQGEVFTWGSNRFGQLGYLLPEVSTKEIPMQLLPRQLYGNIKKELIIGAAASSIHSAIYTTTALYTFGKNEGQLGLMDADARSLELQTIPRRVGVSILQAGIRSVSAVDRATAVLLESHDVVVFTHYGWTRVLFPLESFNNHFMSETLSTRYNSETNQIQKITSGGNTICARSSFGEVFTLEVPKPTDAVPPSVSTTNPTKARNALPQPSRVWSIKKTHMAATDVAVGQDGSIILCTASGSVWRKEKRANINSTRSKNALSSRPKDYKFVRVPNLTRAIAVRSNAFGAFTAVRKDCEVTREQIAVSPSSLWQDLFPLLVFHEYGQERDDANSESPHLRLWAPLSKDPNPAHIRRSVLMHADAESDFLQICKREHLPGEAQYDAWITSNVTEVQIPIHSFLLKARSGIMRHALTEFQETYYYAIPDVMSIEYGQDGQIKILFHGADFLTLANLVLYLYTDNIIDVWHFTSRALQFAARYRSVRTELMKIATHLELRQLEKAVRIMTDPDRSLTLDMELAINDPDLFSDADVIIELADGAELPAHSVLLCQRCPFFEGLFHGRAGGIWVASRRLDAGEKVEAIRVDLKHINVDVFRMVIRHLYADTGDELFDDVVTKTLDEFLELIIEVMAVANELMIDRLAEICQKVIGKFVTTKNVCQLLNIIAECSVNEFKYAALEYICLNLESMLELRVLDELDEDLQIELDEIIQQNQLAYLPIARSDRAQAELLEKYPELAEKLHNARQIRIDSMRLRSRLFEDEQRSISHAKLRVGSFEKQASSPLNQRHYSTPPNENLSPAPSPAIIANEMGEDLPFDMDEDTSCIIPALTKPLPSPLIRPQDGSRIEAMASSLGKSPGVRDRDMHDTFAAENSSMSSSLKPQKSYNSPSAAKITGFELPKVPWQTSTPTKERVDLKDIMNSVSTPRISGLTEAMSKISTVSAKPGAKLSQKDRKRMQQQQRTQDRAPGKETTADSTDRASKSSPWQNFSEQRKNSHPANSIRVDDKRGPETPGPRPGLRPGPATTERPIPSSQPSDASKRSISSPPITSVAKVAPPQIQSIRHTPLPSRSSLAVNAHTSMADILAQQQTEKLAVREATKRSLQDIQQEQEFQEWWDNESKRIQEAEEEARSVAESARRGKGGHSRGRGRQRRGGGRGGLQADTSGDTKVKPIEQSRGKEQAPGGERGRRGPFRGRGGVH